MMIPLLLLRTFSVAVALTLVQTASANAQDMPKNFKPSADEFINSCTSCHGVDAKGAGFLTRLFRGVDPGDLTQLTKTMRANFRLIGFFRLSTGATRWLRTVKEKCRSGATVTWGNPCLNMDPMN